MDLPPNVVLEWAEYFKYWRGDEPVKHDLIDVTTFGDTHKTYLTGDGEWVTTKTVTTLEAEVPSSGEQFYQRNEHGGFVPCAPDTPGAMDFKAVLTEAAKAIAGCVVPVNGALAQFEKALKRYADLPAVGAELVTQEPETPLPARAFDWGKR